MHFDGKVVVITGAAGNVGGATAENLRQRGARTVLGDRDEATLKDRHKAVANSANHLLVPDVDLTSAEGAEKLMSAAEDYFGRIDVLINTVGTFSMATVAEDTPENWDKVMTLNARTAFLCCRAALPLMKAAGTGRIINISAGAAVKGGAQMSAYSASKAAVIRLTESLSEEVKAEGLTVNCVLPGTLDTPQNREAMPDADTSLWVPLDALADAIAFLASDAARAVTGAALPVTAKG